MTELTGEQVGMFDQDIWSGRTFAEHSQATTARTSALSSKKRQKSQTKTPLFLDLRGGGQTPGAYWETGGALLGEYTTHSFGEYPNEENASRLSQILEACPHPRYALSARACAGIIARAERRGKELPPELLTALQRQLVSKNEPESRGGGKGILIQNEHVGALSTLNNQSVYAFDGYNATTGGTSATLGVNCGMSTGRNGVVSSAGFCPEESAQTRGIGYQEENAPSLRAGVVSATVYSIDQGAGKSTCGVDEDRTPTLATTHGGAPAVAYSTQGVDLYNQALTGTVAMPLTSAASDPHHIPSVIETKGVQCLNDQGGGVMGVTEDVSGTLRAQEHGHQPIVLGVADFYEAYQHHGWRNSEIAGVLTRDQNKMRGDTPLVVDTFGLGSFGTYNKECGTLRASGGDIGGGSENLVASKTQSVVRRLTPKECERLQGFPDEWTNIGAWTDSKGKLHKETSDTARYKALGNSIALPFWFWLLRRISAQYERPATLGSLFDGIGGFPLCWERCNGKGTALWASEIEDFPIAVTKYHFPE